MKRKTKMIAGLMGVLLMFLCGCQGKGSTTETKTYKEAAKDQSVQILIVQDFFESNAFAKKYADCTNFVDWVGERLNASKEGLSITNMQATFANGTFSQGSLTDEYDYVVLALGSGALTEPSKSEMKDAYGKELEQIANACGNATIICAYNFYSMEYEMEIKQALQNTNISNKVISLDFANYDDYLNRGEVPDVHELLGEYIRRAIAGEESLRNSNLDPTKPVIALTFDDGPNTSTTNQVLDVLEKYQIKGSFFLIGNNINAASAGSAKRALSLGCEINTHSKAHAYMNQMTAEDIQTDMKACETLIYENVGVYPSFFRPPYIAVNNTMFANINLPFISGYGCSDWDNSVSADKRASVVLATAKDGAIILLHDAAGNSKTVEALPQIIEGLQAEGYQFVTLTQLFAIKGVVPGTNVVYNNALD